MKSLKGFNLVIITGLSGAGKTQAVHIFEDLGFFCIDNLPPLLIPEVIKMCVSSQDKIWKLAFVIDIRSMKFSGQLFTVLSQFKKTNIKFKILFLEASNRSILNRYKETRREHPLSGGRTLQENIDLERKFLSSIKKQAKKIIDTSDLSLGEFRKEIVKEFIEDGIDKKIHFFITAFGYKYGLPHEADLVFDARFLVNPFYSDTLRPYSGENSKVRNFVLRDKRTKKFLDNLFSFMRHIIPLYIKEGRKYVYIGVGCTGGKHRSVVISDELSKFLSRRKHEVNVIYRDVNKE